MLGDQIQVRTKRQFGAIQALAGQLANFPYQGVGCFRDAVAKPRPFPDMLGNFRNEIDLTNVNKTVAKCAAKAYIGQFQYFGIEYVGECWSGPGGNLTYNKFGPSSQCVNGLGGDESLYVYRFTEPPKPLPSPSSLGCFPAHATVELKNGQRIAMESLKVGHEVKTLDNNGGAKYSEVIAFLHRMPAGINVLLRFDLKGGLHITLTSEHLIYIVARDGMSRSAVFARDVQVGDKLVTSGDMVVPVLTITLVEGTGLYAPLTMDGNMFVDGVLVSCYAHVRSHELGHFVMAPVRFLKSALSFVENLFNVSPSVNNASSRYPSDTVLSSYTTALLALTNYLPFKESILSVSGDT